MKVTPQNPPTSCNGGGFMRPIILKHRPCVHFPRCFFCPGLESQGTGFGGKVAGGNCQIHRSTAHVWQFYHRDLTVMLVSSIFSWGYRWLRLHRLILIMVFLHVATSLLARVSLGKFNRNCKDANAKL